jgi:hypothetical protein
MDQMSRGQAERACSAVQCSAVQPTSSNVTMNATRWSISPSFDHGTISWAVTLEQPPNMSAEQPFEPHHKSCTPFARALLLLRAGVRRDTKLGTACCVYFEMRVSESVSFE